MPALGALTSRRALAGQMATLIQLLGAVGGAVGNTFYVNSTTGSDAAGYGQSISRPFDTVDYAIGQCTANNGDTIVLLPQHAETISGAAGVNQDVAGVRIVGVTRGSARPTFTMSAVASTWAIGAANCSLENVLFVVTDDTTIILDVNKADFLCTGCEFRYGSSKEFVTAIDINGGGANACDRCTIQDCRIVSIIAGSNQGIELGEVADQVTISNCVILGDWANACIHNPTGKVLTRLIIQDCLLENTQTGDHSIELVSACTGFLVRNMYKNDMTQATGVDPGSCFSFQCFHCDAIDVSGILAPVAT